MEGMNPISLEEFLACAIFGAVFTYTAVRGMSAIEKVATVFSPLILIVAVIAGVVFIAQAGGVGPFLNEAGKLGGMGLGDGITIVVGSWIAGAIMGVDMFRFNKSVKAVWLCAAACFVMTNPILNFVRLHRRRSQWGSSTSCSGCWEQGSFWRFWASSYGRRLCGPRITQSYTAIPCIPVRRWMFLASKHSARPSSSSSAFWARFWVQRRSISSSSLISSTHWAPLRRLLQRRFWRTSSWLEKRRSTTTKRWKNSRLYAGQGVISFAVGAVLGFVFQYVTALPYGLPSGLFALLVSFVLYIIIYKVTPDAKTDAKVVAELGK